MPTYVYRREDGSTFEIQQRITDDPLLVDPETGQKVERVISGAGFIFKGSGFYLTDYARKKTDGGEKVDGEAKESKSEKKADAGEKSESSNGKKEAAKTATD